MTKTRHLLQLSGFILLSLLFTNNVISQIGGWKPELEKEASAALQSMLDKNPKLQAYYDQAYGYAVFPKVTKAGLGVGGAVGKGIAYKRHKPVGKSKLKSASFGFQAGGQQYKEVIFFKDKAAFDNFTNGHLKFDAQASAVALEEGASIDVAYKDGVAVFTESHKGLMYEASIGGQHFTYDELD